MKDFDKDAFMGGIELGIDWNFPDIPSEDIELYYKLAEEREQQRHQVQEMLQEIAALTSPEFAEQAADHLDSRKHYYSLETYLIMLGQLKKLIDEGMPNCLALEAVQTGETTENILHIWRCGD